MRVSCRVEPSLASSVEAIHFQARKSMSSNRSFVINAAVCSAVLVVGAGCGAPNTRDDAARAQSTKSISDQGGEETPLLEVSSRFSSTDRAYIEHLASCEIVDFSASRDDGEFDFILNDTIELENYENYEVFDFSYKMAEASIPNGFDSTFDVKVTYDCQSTRGESYQIIRTSSMWYDDDLY